MKKRFVSLLGAASLSLSLSASIQGTPVTLQESQTPLSIVLSQIESQTNLLFAYNEAEIDLGRKVSVNVKDKALDEVLESLFCKTAIDYEIEGRNIVLSSKTEIKASVGQTKEIKGCDCRQLRYSCDWC